MRITQFTLLNAIAAFGKISLHALATELVLDRTLAPGDRPSDLLMAKASS